MLRKKRNNPAILSATQKFREKPSRIFDGRRLIISGDSRSVPSVPILDLGGAAIANTFPVVFLIC
ncbi:MAG: hypothetical protein QNJ41_11325 [Xenococcaceae cyanobacterium MO_188.B32]|nr:hypothetical protein [Xenococcaceae cyanobacterium MO_188.B32]